MRGQFVVVGGHSRRVGKTSVMRWIQRALPAMNWHAVKISSHHSHHHGRHDAAAATPNLLRLNDTEFAGGISGLIELLAEGRHLLVESNRIASHLRPDLVIFVVDPLNPDWKDSAAACLARADALVFSQDGPCPAHLLALQRLLPAFRLTGWDDAPLGFDEWLRERIVAAEVTSHEKSVPAFHNRCSSRCGADGCRYQANQMGQRAGTGFGPFPAGSLELV